MARHELRWSSASDTNLRKMRAFQSKLKKDGDLLKEPVGKTEFYRGCKLSVATLKSLLDRHTEYPIEVRRGGHNGGHLYDARKLIKYLIDQEAARKRQVKGKRQETNKAAADLGFDIADEDKGLDVEQLTRLMKLSKEAESLKQLQGDYVPREQVEALAASIASTINGFFDNFVDVVDHDGQMTEPQRKRAEDATDRQRDALMKLLMQLVDGEDVADAA